MIQVNGLNQQGDSEEAIAMFCQSEMDREGIIADEDNISVAEIEEMFCEPKKTLPSSVKVGLTIISKPNKRSESQKARRKNERVAKRTTKVTNVLANALADSWEAKINGAEPRETEKVGGMHRFVEGV